MIHLLIDFEDGNMTTDTIPNFTSDSPRPDQHCFSGEAGRDLSPASTVTALAEASVSILIALAIILLLTAVAPRSSHGGDLTGPVNGSVSPESGVPRFVITARSGATALQGLVTMAEAFDIVTSDPDLSSAVADVVLSTAAAPGKVRKIEPAVVYYRLRLAGFFDGAYLWDDPSTLSISTPARTIGASEIEKAIMDRIAASLSGMDYEAEIRGQVRDLVIEDVDFILEVTEPDIRSCGYNTMKVRVVGPGDYSISSITFRISIKFFAGALVAAREIGLGETIGRDCLTMERVMINPATDDVVSDLGQLEGMVAGRRISKGTAVRRHMFERPLLVKGNSEITVTATEGGVTISLICRALGPGSEGDVVRVMNPGTRKIFSARITGTASAEAVN